MSIALFWLCARVAGVAAAVLVVGSSLCLPLSVQAQGAVKPVEALIVNPPTRPIPVSVVPPATPATAMCRMNVDTSGNLLPVPSEGRGIRIEDLACTPGVTKLDVQRVVFTTGAFGSPTENQVHYTISLAFAHFIGTAAFIDAPIATLSNGSPDLSLGQPVRIDKSALGVAITSSIMCSSGIAGLAPRCSGTVFLIGTPVN